MLTKDRQNQHPPMEGVNHERIIINYDNPKITQSYQYEDRPKDLGSGRDSDAASTDSGKPPSLTGKQRLDRPISFRNEHEF